MFCGDLAQKGTTIYIPPNLQGDLLAYLASLERVLALRPAQLLPAHGPVIDDPDYVLRGYIEHRREREEQILELLRGGESSPDVMVIRMYRGLKDTLVPMARESVLAHLLKLEHEGRARRSGGAVGRGCGQFPGEHRCSDDRSTVRQLQRRPYPSRRQTDSWTRRGS